MLVHNNSDNLQIIGYVDLDFAGNPNDMKSMSSYVFKMDGGNISGKIVKQSITAFFTLQVEFTVSYEATIQAMLLKTFV